MKPDFTDAVLISNLIIASLYNDVIFVYGWIIDVLVIDGEDGVVVGHGRQSEYGWFGEYSAVVDTFVGHSA